MIIAERKPIEEILNMIGEATSVLLAGCATCVADCMAGGEREVGILASALRIALTRKGKSAEILEATVERQCEWEFVERIRESVERADIVISTACGIGVQAMAERYDNKPIYPGVNTSFLGLREEEGLWVERCAACGECTLHLTGGICPVARCSKSLLNGPCGGSTEGKCEISEETDCGWQLIVDRLKALGQLERLETAIPPKNWAASRDGGPRKVIKKELRVEKRKQP
ncbi:MAG: methylenetetrahydrofolate reductase C-terminal domain-containing protein [Candidatus Hydrogenedentota bacterium]|nr:MAG: methylenetetrahydrofolate reductase C-terminal domain-containing protein [Candidatus Hydrogenedentota bacterium]